MDNYIDVEKELARLLAEEIDKAMFSTINEELNIYEFMYATDNNLNMLFKYMTQQFKDIHMTKLQVGEFIKKYYYDDSFYERECLDIINKIKSL